MTQRIAIVLAGIAISLSSVVMEAPENFPYLWIVKAATISTAGVAMLLINPDAVLSVMKSKIAGQFGVEIPK